MKTSRLCLIATLFLSGALAPIGTPAQSQNSSDEIRELRKLVEEMRVQMSKMQTEIDQLKGTKTEALAHPATAPAGSPSLQDGTIESAEPPQESTLSTQIGEAMVKTRLQPRGLIICLSTRCITASLNCLEHRRF